MLTRFVILCSVVFSLCFASVSSADEAAKSAITETIQSQIDAFQKDDFERAFSFASPMIKQIFGTPQNFGAMVARGYPMVHRPAEVRFLELREIAGVLYQKVQVRDASGKTHLIDYQMIATQSGWQINGVQLLKSQGVAA